MGEIVIVILDIIAVLVATIFILIGLTQDNSQKRKIRVVLKDIVNKIISVFAIPIKKYKTQSLLTKIYIGLIALMVLLIFSLLFYSYNAERLKTYFSIKLLLNTLIEVFITMGLFYILVLLIEIFVGSLILEYINNINNYIGNIAFASLFIPFLVLASLSINNKSKTNIMAYLSLLFLFFSHIIVYKGLYLIINKPDYLSIKTHKLNQYSKYIGMIVWLLILIFNLYSAVFLITRIDSNAFVDTSNNPVNDPIELLYFTITSLITIGFGDITPNSHWGKGVMVLIFISGLYYLVIFIGTVLTASISNKDTLYGFINRRVNLIVNNLNELLSNIEKESEIDIPRNEISKSNIYRALSSINIEKKSLVLDEYDCNGNWIKYLNYSKKHCLQNIREIFIFSTQLEPEMLNILLEIEDSDYFELLDNRDIEVTSNSNLGFMTNRFIEYILQIYELEKYRKANLDEHKRERRRLLPIAEKSDKVDKIKEDKRGNSIQG